MKTTLPVVFILILLCSQQIYCQSEGASPVRAIKIREIQVITGANVGRTNFRTSGDFKALAPQSKLLYNDFSDYVEVGGDFSSSAMFSVQLGIHFRNQEKTGYRKNPLLRLGLGYYTGSGLSQALYRFSSVPLDTLVSDQTGQTLYVDSVYQESYNMNHRSEQVRLEGSLIFRTDPDARWHLFSGFGFSLGYSINAQTELQYVISENIETTNAAGTIYSATMNSTFDRNVREVHENKTQFACAGYVPLGVNFRIGNKREFWKRAHLFYELRPMLTYTSIPELGSDTRAGLQHGLGFRVTWD